MMEYLRQTLSQAAKKYIPRIRSHRKQRIHEESSGTKKLVNLQMLLTTVKNTIKNPIAFSKLDLIKKVKDLKQSFPSLYSDLSKTQNTDPQNFLPKWNTTISSYICQHKSALQILTNYKKKK